MKLQGHIGRPMKEMFHNLQGRDTAPVYSFGGAIGVLLYGMMETDDVDDAVEEEVLKSLTRFVASRILSRCEVTVDRSSRVRLQGSMSAA